MLSALPKFPHFPTLSPAITSTRKTILESQNILEAIEAQSIDVSKKIKYRFG